MERNFPIERAFISRVNPVNDLGSRCCAPNVRQFWEAESFNNAVKVIRRYNWETSEENSTTFEEKRLQPWLMSSEHLLKQRVLMWYCLGIIPLGKERLRLEVFAVAALLLGMVFRWPFGLFLSFCSNYLP
ncbi:hypothetical protein HanIR_Chr16g0801151 [Helianthus annuus]|nr:hypothetical protein HanIR_Chr16g0801151 [Helianthus annuus]